jgi:hypothetical protein
MDERKKLYSLFHLNLAFSAIPESERATVVARCYAPLLKLARNTGCPVTIEASAWTLLRIAEIDPGWISNLRALIADGLCEFIGSGYVQAIGPLMPERANVANQRIGLDVYQQLLGMRPYIALVNEQALSAGLIPIYRDAGYLAMILDWANVFSAHQDWNPTWAHYPQTALDPAGDGLPVIWCDAIAFQKFQRHAHGEITLDDYEAYVDERLARTQGGFLPVYGSDAEIFDYRPGRYGSEAAIKTESEWQRIEDLFHRLSGRDDAVMTTPSAVLETGNVPGAWNKLHLQTASAPVAVKKQPKYNIVRWAVTGRDDLALNTACWRLFDALVENLDSTDDEWRELLELWSSDFRTHIDDARWQSVTDTVSAIAKRPKVRAESLDFSAAKGDFLVSRDERTLALVGVGNAVTLNLRRGAAVQSMALGADQPWWVGTIPHGYFDDITWGADFYTGHLVCEIPGQPKITDLKPITPDLAFSTDGSIAQITAILTSELGQIRKTVTVHSSRPRVEVAYDLDWPEPVLGSLRMAHATLNPDVFGNAGLSYSCHNGGAGLETFDLGDQEIDLGAPVSGLITCGNGLGITGGVLEIGDRQRRIRIEAPRSDAAMIGLVMSHKVGARRFLRASLSAREHDDTSREGTVSPLPIRPLTYRYAIELVANGAA